jgi:predicted MFS family arabinose efflux permease
MGRRIDTFGGREVLAFSNVVFAAGLIALALAPNMAMVVLAWLILGLGMGVGLYDAAFATLGRLYGTSARSTITGISLLGGFASTVGWPLSAWGVEAIGWRHTCLAWAGVHMLLALPLNMLLVPRIKRQAVTIETDAPAAIEMDRNMWLLAIAFAGIWFVATAMGAHLPKLLEAAGATPVQAVAAAALMGPAQVAARLVEAGFLSRYHPLMSARLAALAHPLAIGLLAFGGVAFAPVFACVHGAGNGILTIARGTVPLSIYGAQNYGYRLGLLGAPGRASQAFAPLLFSFALEYYGVYALVLSGVLGLVTCAAFWLVRQLREEETRTAA